MPSQILHTIFGEDVINGLRSRPETAGLKGIFTGCTSGAGETGCGAFSLGCQGPDIFYHSQRHKPVALEYGSLLHRRGCGTFSASLINMALQDKEDARETSLHYARETSLHYARETSLQNTGNLHYALGFMTHAFLDRHCHPYIIYHAGREYHSFFERIIDVLMLMELRRHDPVSWDKEKILADVCENPPAGLKELIISSLAETFPEKAGKDRSLAKRIDNTFVDCARFYNMTSPARIKEAFSGGERPAVSRRAINYMYPENLSSEIDCMRRVHTPPLWGETKGMNPETNTLPKQPYPVRSAAGLVDFLNLNHKLWRYPCVQPGGKTKDDSRSFPEIYAHTVETAVAALAPCFIQYMNTGIFPIDEAAQSIGNSSLSIQDEEGRPCAPNLIEPLPLEEVFREQYRIRNQ